MIQLKIILASTREGRQGESIARWVAEKATNQKDVAVELLDLREYPMPFYDEPVSASQLTGEYKHKEVEKWAAKVKEADAYIIVTPEYNHAYPAVLKNALDYVYYEWNNKPVTFVSYGFSASGARAVEQLRQVAIELQMAPIREAAHLSLPKIMQAQSVEKAYTDEKLAPVFQQLLWWARALKEAREKGAHAA